MKPENISYQLYNRTVCTQKISQMPCPQTHGQMLWPSVQKLISPAQSM